MYDSIEEWANAHTNRDGSPITLEDALEAGVSQKDDGEIVVPDDVQAMIVPVR